LYCYYKQRFEKMKPKNTQIVDCTTNHLFLFAKCPTVIHENSSIKDQQGNSETPVVGYFRLVLNILTLFSPLEYRQPSFFTNLPFAYRKTGENRNKQSYNHTLNPKLVVLIFAFLKFIWKPTSTNSEENLFKLFPALRRGQ
jgi:hypothetical protein